MLAVAALLMNRIIVLFYIPINFQEKKYGFKLRLILKSKYFFVINDTEYFSRDKTTTYD